VPRAIEPHGVGGLVEEVRGLVAPPPRTA